jgi:hypothetical protein
MTFDDLDPEEIEALLALVKKKAEEEDENDEEGDGTEPSSDEDQVELFPDDPTEVETSPDMGDTENKLPPGAVDDGGHKLREAFRHVLMRRAKRNSKPLCLRGRNKLRKDPANDGIVPLKTIPFTKEQTERLDQCRALQIRMIAKEVLVETVHKMRVNLKAGEFFFRQRCLAEMRKKPFFVREMINVFNKTSKQ